MTTMQRTLLLAALILAGVFAGGCQEDHYADELNAESGLVVILPGIQGIDEHSYAVSGGLRSGGVRRALVLQRWGKDMPAVGMLINQVDKVGIRFEAMKIAGKIIDYQKEFPDRPVHILGHSGGGALAVFIAESLADQGFNGARPIEGLVLLSPSISPIYNLDKALSICNAGILHCYNPEDVAILGGGTTMFGNLDGVPGPAAGLNGFRELDDFDPTDEIATYGGRLTQIQVPNYGDPHFASVQMSFIRRKPSQWILYGKFATPVGDDSR